MPFGRNGERVAKTPLFSRPPSLGGVTSGVNFSTLFSENPHIIHKCENSSIPRSASGFWYFGSNTICPAASGTRPLCLGMPNFSPNPVCIIATGSIVFSYIFLYQYFIQYIILEHKLLCRVAVLLLMQICVPERLHGWRHIYRIQKILLSHAKSGRIVEKACPF